MKTLFSLPKDDGFFNRYATLIPTLRKLGVLSQVINAITEVGIIYAVVFSLLSEFWGAYAAPLAVVGAIIGTAVIELGLRQFLPYSSRAVLYRRFQGLDLWMSVFILVSTLALFTCSLTLSFKGSKAMVEAVTPAPDVKSTDSADAAFSTGKTDAAGTFSRDSAEISTRYAGLIAAQKSAYTTRITNERETLADLKKKEQRTAQRYETQKQRARDKINALESEQAAKIAELETAKAGEMSAATQRKTGDLERITAAHSATTADINGQNTTARIKSETRVKTYGSGLAWFTLIFHFVLVLAVALDEMHKKGSGIEQVAQPNQYHFSESIWAAFWNTVSDKWNYHARTKIKNWADQTPAPPRPSDPPTLYELADWKPRRVTLPMPDNTVKTPYTAANTDAVSELMDSTKGHSNGNGNAKNFSNEKEQPTVEIPADETPPHSTVNNATVTHGGFVKDCAHCGKAFTAKVNWQKFCSEDCKLAYHEARHGAKFDPKQYRKRQPVTT